jgi:hypothetical protein
LSLAYLNDLINKNRNTAKTATKKTAVSKWWGRNFFKVEAKAIRANKADRTTIASQLALCQ